MVWATSLDEGLTALSDATVTELKFSYQIGVEGAKQVAEALKHNTTLTMLDFQNNEIGDEGAKQIADALQHNKTLSTLHLESNQIGAEGAKHIAERLKHNTTLTTLSLDYNIIGAEGTKHVAEALKNNITLTTLDLQRNYIYDEGAKHIADALYHSKTLSTLYLESNHILAEGANYIAEALRHNTILRALNLEGNDIGDEGAKHIAEALKHNNTLETLYLYGNGIGDEGAKHFAAALDYNKTLSTLHLEYNGIGDEGAKHIADALQHNKTLSTLHLSSNHILAEGAKHIAEALKHNTTLTLLDLEANVIGCMGAMSIADAIKYNTTLAYLNLNTNEIGKEGVEFVKEAVKESLDLRQRLQKWPKPTTTHTRKRKLSTEQVVDNLSAQPNCCVCMDPKDQLLLLPCLHHVCAQCLQDVKKMSLCVCRVCQEPFSADLLVPHSIKTPNIAICCSQHPDNNATKFCINCNVLVCAACDHDTSHQLYDLDEAMKKIKNDVPPILDDLLVQLGQVNEAIEYIEFARSSALNKLVSIKSAIQLSFEALNNPEVTSQRDALFEQAQTIANSQVKILDMQHEDLIAAKDARETALQQARCLLAADVTQLRVYNMVLRRIQLLLNNPLQLEPLVFDVLRFKQLDPDNNLIGHVFEDESQQLDVQIDLLNVETDKGNDDDDDDDDDELEEEEEEEE